MSAARVLVAGVGNIFRGDDAFGGAVARLLMARPLPAGVRVIDFGVRGYDLAYALLDDYNLAVIVDASCRGGPPGTLYTIVPDLAGTNDEPPAVEAHATDLRAVARLVRALGGALPPLRLVGCEPADLGPDDEGAMGLSGPVRNAVGPAADLVESLIAEALGPEGADGR